MTRTLSLAFAAAALLPAAALPAQTPTEADAERLGGILDTAATDGAFHGSALVVAAAGDAEQPLRVVRATGNADQNTPNSPTTRFPIASLSKLLTQAAILRLVDRGELALDAPVARYRPLAKGTWPREVTVRHLLAMTSGLPRELGDDPSQSGVELDRAGLAGPYLDDLELELDSRPGTRSAYSNVGYWYLGAVVEGVTGKTFEGALRELVLEPCGMTATGYAVALDDDGPGLARGHAIDGDETVPAPAFDRISRYASGGLFSTTTDLARFCHAIEAGDLLSESSGNAFFAHFRADAEPDRRRVFAAGLLPGFRNLLMHENGTTVVVLNNLAIDPPDRCLGLVQQLARAAQR